MDIVKELKDYDVIIALMPGSNYTKETIKILKDLKDQNICYVTNNKTFSSFKEDLKKHKLGYENIIFIDSISKTISDKKSNEKGCYYCNSPDALTEIALVIDKMLDHNIKYLIFDSLSSLLVYQKKAPVAKFVASITHKIRKSGAKGIFFSLSINEQEDLIKETQMFVDNTLSFEKSSESKKSQQSIKNKVKKKLTK